MSSKQRIIHVFVLIVVSLLSVGSIATAAAVSYKGQGTITFDRILTGALSVTGVSRLNGTVLNDSKNAKGENLPLTIGDDLRVDGRIWRGKTMGPTDSQPLILADNVEVAGTLKVQGLPVSGESEEELPFVVLGPNFVRKGDVIYVLLTSWTAMDANALKGLPAADVVSMNSQFAMTKDGQGWYNQGVDGWRSVGYIPEL